jgi:hypothetical protein
MLIPDSHNPHSKDTEVSYDDTVPGNGQMKKAEPKGAFGELNPDERMDAIKLFTMLKEERSSIQEIMELTEGNRFPKRDLLILRRKILDRLINVEVLPSWKDDLEEKGLNDVALFFLHKRSEKEEQAKSEDADQETPDVKA